MQNYAFSILSEFEKQLPYYLVGVGFRYTQEVIRRPFGYPYYQWIQTVAGAGGATIAGREYEVGENRAMFLFPEDGHEYRSVDPELPWVVHWFTFGGYHIDQLLHTLGFSASGVYGVGNAEILDARVEQGLVALRSKRSSRGLDCSALVYSTLLDIYRHAYLASDESLEHRHQRLAPVFELVARDYDKPLSIEALSGAVGLSPQHFCVVFKQATNCRPVEYLNLYRIRKAKELLLKESEQRIQDIAKSVGYPNVAYFTTLFRKLEGVSPSDFRRGQLSGNL